MTKDLKQFTNIIRNILEESNHGYGLSLASARHFIPLLTEALELHKNKHWQKLCFDYNTNAQDYIKLNQQDLLQYNGMSLCNWDEDKINKKYIFTAINASKHPLTPGAVSRCKKIRKLLNNKDILKLAKEQGYATSDYNYTHYNVPNPFWLKCLDKKNIDMSKLAGLKTLEDWVTYFGLPFFLLDRTGYKRFEQECHTILQLNPPKELQLYLNEIFAFAVRYNTANPQVNWGKKETVLLSLNLDEQYQFETYLKMKGYNYIKDWNSSLRYDEHYQNNLFALHECLIAKYIKRKEQVI